MELSIVIPIFNEEQNILILSKKLIENIPNNLKYEIIFVDDGSTDNSIKLIKNTQKK